MAIASTHPHAEFDRFPTLLQSVRQEFGAEGLMSNVARFIAAELADFYWDGRIAERDLGACDGLDDEEETAVGRVAIIGFFRERYYVATCVVDARRQIAWMLALRHFDSFADAEQAFLAGEA